MTKKELMQIKRSGDKLTKKVVNVILDHGTVEDMKSFIRDVQYGGCQAGTVGELVYYTDTLAFYKKYRKEITSLLREMMSDTGSKSPAGLFGKNWDDEDPLAQDTHNQNLLAWFGFEETLNRVASQWGIDE